MSLFVLTGILVLSVTSIMIGGLSMQQQQEAFAQNTINQHTESSVEHCIDMSVCINRGGNDGHFISSIDSTIDQFNDLSNKDCVDNTECVNDVDNAGVIASSDNGLIDQDNLASNQDCELSTSCQNNAFNQGFLGILFGTGSSSITQLNDQSNSETVEDSVATNDANNFAFLSGTIDSTVGQANQQNNDNTEDRSSATNRGSNHATLFSVFMDPITGGGNTVRECQYRPSQ